MIASDEFKMLLPAKQWVVAYSGGVDSTVLLHAAQQFLKSYPATADQALPQLSAVYINHQLQSDSERWQQHCEAVCQSWSIPFAAETVTIAREEIQQQGMEASARDERYRVFARYAKPGSVVMTGHHLNDQAETVLMRLFRGAGGTGLAGIPALRELAINEKADQTMPREQGEAEGEAQGKIIRPLLSVNQQTIERYAQDYELLFINDPSNNDTDMDRNFIRHSVVPLVKQRWPGLIANLARTANHARSQNQLLRELAQIDIECIDRRADDYGHSVDLPGLTALSEHRQINLIRYWLTELNHQLPSTKQMQQVISVLRSTRADAYVALSQVAFYRFKQRVYCIQNKCLEFSGADSKATESLMYPRNWNTHQSVTMDRIGVLSGHVSVADTNFGLKPGDYVLDSRVKQEGQEYLYRGQHRSLKKLLQEQGIPPWLRDVYPIIYYQDAIAAIGDILVCDDYSVAGGLQLEWQWCLV